jgi:hypothetical protein
VISVLSYIPYLNTLYFNIKSLVTVLGSLSTVLVLFIHYSLYIPTYIALEMILDLTEVRIDSPSVAVVRYYSSLLSVDSIAVAAVGRYTKVLKALIIIPNPSAASHDLE